MTAADVSFPLEDDEFAESLRVVKAAIDVDARLPQMPFLRLGGHFAISEFMLNDAGSFERVLLALATAHGDHDVIFAVLEPDYYAASYGLNPAFRISTAALQEGARFWEALNYEPGGNPADAFMYSARVVAVTGDTGRWAVWSERYWEISVLHSDIREGLWLDLDVSFASAQYAYDNWVHPSWINTPIDQNERSIFIEQFKEAVVSSGMS